MSLFFGGYRFKATIPHKLEETIHTSFWIWQYIKQKLIGSKVYQQMTIRNVNTTRKKLRTDAGG
ncbi:hypothetical protein A616_14725 [Brevibacillus brevis X23]|nr:hypothetical protein A616_14725 [Brevibacillus brevis X23]